MSLILCKIPRLWGQRFFEIAGGRGGPDPLPPPPLVKGAGTKRLGKGRVKSYSRAPLCVWSNISNCYVLQKLWHQKKKKNDKTITVTFPMICNPTRCPACRTFYYFSVLPVHHSYDVNGWFPQNRLLAILWTFYRHPKRLTFAILSYLKLKMIR